jgi:hypothetical protein
MRERRIPTWKIIFIVVAVGCVLLAGTGVGDRYGL